MCRHTTAHLYAVPVLERFDAVRNCSHCRKKHRRRLCGLAQAKEVGGRSGRQDYRRYAKGVDELLEATSGRPAIIYEYHAGSVAYFTPDAPDFAEAGELKGDDLAAARRILEERGLPGGNTR